MNKINPTMRDLQNIFKRPKCMNFLKWKTEKKYSQVSFYLGGVDTKSGVNTSFCLSQERVLNFSYFSGIFLRIELDLLFCFIR